MHELSAQGRRSAATILRDWRALEQRMGRVEDEAELRRMTRRSAELRDEFRAVTAQVLEMWEAEADPRSGA